MKRIFVIILLIACLFVMTSCGGKKAQIDSDKGGFFVVITEYQAEWGSFTNFVYDPFTKIVYLYVSGVHHVGLSPYYTIKNGEPVIARYGINWTEDM